MKKSTTRIAAILIAIVMLIGCSVGIITASASPYYQQATVDNINKALEDYETKVKSGAIYTNMSDAYKYYVELSQILDRYYYGNENVDSDVITNAIYYLNDAISKMTTTFTAKKANNPEPLDGSYTKAGLLTNATFNAASGMTSTQWTNVSDIQSGVLSYYGLGDSAPWSYGTLGNDSSGVGRAGAHFGLQYGFVVFLYDGSSTELAVPVNMFYGRNNTSGTWRPATLYPADGQPVELRHAWHGTNGTQTTNPGYLRDTSETLSWVPFVSGQTDWPALGHSNKQTYLSNTMYYKQSAISFTSTSPYLKTDTISWYMQYNGSNGNLTFAHGDGTSNTSNGVPTIRILNYKALIDAVNSATIKNYLANVNLYREGGLTDIMATLDTATAFDPNKPFENVTASGIDAAINSAVSTISGVVTGLNVTPEQDAYAGLRAAISKARATYFADTTLALGYGGNNPLAADGINKVYCSKPYEEFAKLYKEIADYGPNSNRNANAFMRVAGFTGNYTQGKQANTYATQLEAKLDAVKNHTKGSTNMYKVPDDSTHRKATCTVDGVGVEYSTCPNCYEEYISNNAYPIASGHTTVFTSAESLSCTTGGKPAYWHCERSESDLVAAGCGKYFADNNGVAGTEINGIPDELPALGHIFGDTPAQTKQDATCLHGSYKEIWKCDRCGLDFLDNDEFNAAPASANDLGEQNDKKEHAFREHEPVENSCHQAGNEHYWSCDTCDTFFHSASATDIWDVEQEGSPILPQLAHSFGEYTYDEDSQKDDKCVTPGTMTATCENCGDKDTILDPANPAIGHKFKADNAKHEREMPTCYDEGKILYYTCDNCGNNYATDSPDSVVPLESYQLVIPAIGVHTLIEHGAREATCQQKGYETYYECSVCLGKFKSNDQTAGIEAFEDNKIANFDGEGDNAWAKDGTHRIITMGGEPATCITAREASHYECVWCSTWFDSDDADTAKEIPEEQPEAAIDPDNHINLWIIHTEHTASCTEEGWSETVYECQGCGEFYKNHDGSANTASATKLTEEALKEIRSETVPHNELGTRETTQEITPATCTTVGYENVTVYCTACDQNQKVEAREIPKTDHKFGDAVNEKAATCLNPGVPVTYYTCSSCNLNYTDNAPKTEKVYSGDVVTPATGHSFELGEKGVPGTCEKDGTNTYYVCTNANCELGKNAKFLDPNDTTATRGATEEELTDVSPKNHTKLSYKPAVAADCSTWQAGKIAHIYCDGCKNYYTTYDHWGEEPIDPDDEALTIKPSHKLTHYSQDSSCLDYGWKDVYVCDDCGAAFTSETPNVKDGLTDEEIESDIIIPAPGHSFGDYIATDATCIVAGEVGHYECSECKIAVKCDEADATKEEVLFYAGDDSNDLSTPATGHEFGAVIAEDPATCTGEGTAAHYECANCDIVIKDFDGINLDSFKYEENGYDIVITELGHEEADPIQMDIVPSSCTAEGSYTKVVRCVRYDACGYVFSRVENQILAKADHVAAYQKVTAQTAGDCQTNGTITVGTVCANCNSVYNTFTLETDKGDHKYDDGEVTKKPTCVDKGETTYTCSVCGNSYSEKNIPETGIHDYYAEVTKEPTCAENGVTTYTCSVCGDSYSEENITATGKHEYDMGVVTKEPTCAEYGETTYTCVVCGDTYTVADALPTGEHNYDGVVTKDATCTEWGETTYTCTVCGDSYTEENVPATGEHEYYAEVTKEPTCAENGETTYTCSVCGDSYSEENISATGEHEYDMGVVTKEPTCAEWGETTYTCVVCGDTYTTDDVLPTGEHNYNGVVTKDATCAEWGETTYTCTVCGDSYTEENVPPTGEHIYKDEVTIEATCVSKGVTTYTCEVCGDSYFEEDIPATGKHTYDSGIIAKEPTCVDEGETTYTCKVCGDSYTAKDIAATGEHTYDKGVVTKAPTCVDKGETTYTCKVCGDSYTAKDIAATGEHTYDKGVVTKAPTATEAGEKTFTCTVCGNTRVEPIPALGGGSTEESTKPGETPSEQPSETPSEDPTETPSEDPTEVPSEDPTETPSEDPTEVPSEDPTETPSEDPTEAPSEDPTEVPGETTTEQPSDSNQGNGSRPSGNNSGTSPATGLALSIPVFSLAALTGGFFFIGYARKKKNEDEE